jgi:hypothetical protein
MRELPPAFAAALSDVRRRKGIDADPDHPPAPANVPDPASEIDQGTDIEAVTTSAPPPSSMTPIPADPAPVEPGGNDSTASLAPPRRPRRRRRSHRVPRGSDTPPALDTPAGNGDDDPTDPTPEEIATMCLAIQQEWSDQERRLRARGITPRGDAHGWRTRSTDRPDVRNPSALLAAG